MNNNLPMISLNVPLSDILYSKYKLALSNTVKAVETNSESQTNATGIILLSEKSDDDTYLIQSSFFGNHSNIISALAFNLIKNLKDQMPQTIVIQESELNKFIRYFIKTADNELSKVGKATIRNCDPDKVYQQYRQRLKEAAMTARSNNKSDNKHTGIIILSEVTEDSTFKTETSGFGGSENIIGTLTLFIITLLMSFTRQDRKAQESVISKFLAFFINAACEQFFVKDCETGTTDDNTAENPDDPG